MKNSFVSYLGTDSFLPGVLALHNSVKTYNQAHGFAVLVSDSVSEDSIDLLLRNRITTRIIKEIDNPCDLGADERGFKYMYTKLRLFEWDEFDKMVYIDADMIVCGNIEALFEAPHMSADAAGGFIQSNSNWKDLNAGLMVIEPNKALFDEMKASITQLPSKDGSDQGFLHSFFPAWPADKSLHLDHAFNVPLCYLDEYCRSGHYNFEYKRRSLHTNISVIHYWGKYKPWQTDYRALRRKTEEKWEQALLLWWDTFNACCN
ncbi:MAG: hypothetical protein JST19_02165 [Bacteroidetes bacterium]|nr:hypothetical protein [Bacteroidota bacterium]